MSINEISYRVIGCALRVHRELGPGLLEAVYETCLIHELVRANLSYQTQVPVQVFYDTKPLDHFYRADLVVENVLLVELKALDNVLRVHHNQIITYMRLGGWKLGLLINFNTSLLKNGIYRFILT